MKKKMNDIIKDKLKVIVFILLLCIIVFGLRVYNHENSHKVIYEQFDCYNITIDYNIFESSTTKATCSLNEDSWNALRIAQSQVESNYEDQVTDVLLIILIYVLLLKL